MFRWKRGVLHALIPFALAIAGGLAILVTKDPADPEKLGEGVGRFAFCVFLAGLGISYLAQTGRKKAALWASLALVGAVGALAAVIATTAPVKHMRAADRAPLVDRVIDGSHRLVHPTLGFSILRPPATYRDAPQMAAAMHIDDPDTVVHAYAESPPQAALIVAVMANAGESRGAFEDSVAGIRRGLMKSMTAQLGSAAAAQWVRDDITGDDAHLEAHLHAVVATLALNIAANVVSPANDFANAFPKKIDFKRGGLITGLLGIAMVPWELLRNPGRYINGWLGGYGGALGSIAGVLIIDYWVLRKTELDLAALYTPDGAYRYRRGWNLPAVYATVAGAGIALAGAFWEPLAFIYHWSWFVGFAMSGGIYYALMRGRVVPPR